MGNDKKPKRVNKETRENLVHRQSLPLEMKIELSNQRVKEWYEYWKGKVYVSFSGGKDSTVLLDLVRRQYPEVVGVFSDTGLEFPEIRNFVKTTENITWVRPKMTFKQVLEEYGYPVISKEISEKIYYYKRTESEKFKESILNEGSKFRFPDKWRSYLFEETPFKISHRCCDKLKKQPFTRYEFETKNKGYVGTKAEDSRLRTLQYLHHGCNRYEGRYPISLPLNFWRDKDIWDYIKKYDLPYSKIYDMGYAMTGCIFCMYGVHMEKSPNRFEKLKETHPRLYKYCMEDLGLDDVLTYMDIKH